MHGPSSYRYGNGDVYSGHWSRDQRVGFGRLEENSLKRSFYIGSWSNDKRNGYGIYEDKMRSAAEKLLERRIIGDLIKFRLCRHQMLNNVPAIPYMQRTS